MGVVHGRDEWVDLDASPVTLPPSLPPSPQYTAAHSPVLVTRSSRSVGRSYGARPRSKNCGSTAKRAPPDSPASASGASGPPATRQAAAAAARALGCA